MYATLQGCMCAVLVMYSDRPQYVSQTIAVDNVFTLS
jgi:hypothetical protein